VFTDRPIKHHDVVSTAVFACDISDSPPSDWMKYTLLTVVDAMEASIIEVIAKSPM
jgi:hypothetical protein